MVNMWVNPIKERPLLIAVIMMGNRPGDKAFRIRADHPNLLKHKMQWIYGRL